MDDQEVLIDADIIISAEELCNRIGEGDTAFINRLREGNFTILYSGKPPRTNNGKVYYLCTIKTVDYIARFGFDDYEFEGFFVYTNEYSNYKNDGRSYLDWPICKNGEWIPANDARKLLNMTPREFKYALNRGDIETDKDDERTWQYNAWASNSFDSGEFLFFDDEKIGASSVHRISLVKYADNNDLKLTDLNLGFGANIAELESKIANLQEEKSKFQRWCQWHIKRYSVLEENFKGLEVQNQALEKSCQENTPKTTKATISRLKNRLQELTEGYEGAAKLACEIGRRGPKNGNPWSESEVLTLAGELGVSIKGDCLKSFKAGMPADLVKKDAGARPITPREESLDDVES